MAEARPGAGDPQLVLRALRERTRALRERIAAEAAAVAAAERRAARLAALQEDDQMLGVRLDRLDRLLRLPGVASHVAGAVERCEIVGGPTPHAVIENLWPEDVAAGIRAAVPAAIFFDDPGTRRLELPLPPAVAPLDSIITWRWLLDVVAEALAPILIARFRGVLRPEPAAGVRPAPSYGRLLLRLPGYDPAPVRKRSGDMLRLVLPQPRPGDDSDYGGRVTGAGAARRIPFAANTALVVAGDGQYEDDGIPEGASLERCSYEFPIAASSDAAN